MEARTARPAIARWRTLASDYVQMTKPKVQSLLLFTTVTTMYVAGDPSIGRVLLTCIGGALSAGGAGALYLFAIVFYWTPPHFWALSLLMKDEYRRARVPMLPVVRGERETRRQIVLYALLLVAVTMLPFAGRLFDGIYLAAALLLGGVLMWLALRLSRRADKRSALRLYLYSLAYL